MQKTEFLPDDLATETEDEAVFPAERKGVEMIKTEIPQLKAPKIVGKIDLDAINTKTKPKKKSRKALLEEQEQRVRAEKEKREELKEARIAKRKEERKEATKEEKKETTKEERKRRRRSKRKKEEREEEILRQSDMFEQEVEREFEQGNKNKRKRHTFFLIPKRVFDWFKR